MSACEKCWSEATWRTHLKGGFTADHYRDLLIENETHHAAEPTAKEATDE